MAERNKDSDSEANESVDCENCGESHEILITNSFGGANVSVGSGDTDVNFYFPYYDEDDTDVEFWNEAPPEQLRILNMHLDSAIELLQLQVCQETSFSLNVMIYGHVVAATEGFLSSVFIKTTTTHEELIQRLLETDPKFADMKISMSELFRKRESIKETVASYLRDLIFHDLKKVKPMYKSVLRHDLGDISWLFKAVSKRHDCVHRAGYDKDGNQLTFVEGEIKALIQNVRALCTSIMVTVTELEKNQSPPF